jgi:hypothetical protein
LWSLRELGLEVLSAESPLSAKNTDLKVGHYERNSDCPRAAARVNVGKEDVRRG